MKQCPQSLLLKLTTTSIIRGGNVFGYGVGAKFGFSAKEQDGYAQARQENVEMMHISYNVRGHTLHG